MELLSTAAGVAGGVALGRGVARLREHRTVAAGLADLLGWGFLVADGVVLQKDGSLLAGYRYAGPDVSAATPAELDALSRHVNDALLPFADDWMLHVDAVRRPAGPYPASAVSGSGDPAHGRGAARGVPHARRRSAVRDELRDGRDASAAARDVCPSLAPGSCKAAGATPWTGTSC